MIKLGEKVRCLVTGFTGTATRRVEVLHGSCQVYVEGFDSGYRRDEWIEEGRLRVADGQSVASVSSINPSTGRPPT